MCSSIGALLDTSSGAIELAGNVIGALAGGVVTTASFKKGLRGGRGSSQNVLFSKRRNELVKSFNRTAGRLLVGAGLWIEILGGLLEGTTERLEVCRCEDRVGRDIF